LSRRHDFLVLGGGPAGATFAALAAAAGASVLLLERERFPREKLCGEFLSAEGVAVLERLSLLGELRKRGAVSIGACRITDARGRTVAADLPELPGLGREGLGLSRATLDGAVLSLAAKRGVKIRDRVEATVPILSNGRVIGMRHRQVGSQVFGEAATAAVVVAADGRKSRLVQALHPKLGDPLRSTKHSWFGLQTHVLGASLPDDRRIELCLFPGGYAGLSRVENGRVNLCLLATVEALRACGGSPDDLLRERILANATALAVLGDAPVHGEWKSVGPLKFGPRRPCASGVLFLGDAAGTVDPFCGEGMSLALRSAELALSAALEGASTGALEADAARRYERAWRAELAPVLKRARALGWLLERPRAASATLRVLGLGKGALFSRVVAATRPGSRAARSY